MSQDKLPIRMLHDRVLVEIDKESGERRSSGGIVIPATAALGGARRLAWCRVVAVGAHVRTVEVGSAFVNVTTVYEMTFVEGTWKVSGDDFNDDDL